MKTLKEQLDSYAEYHHNRWNKLTHFVGVPLVTFALFLFLSWFRLVEAPTWPLTAATVFFLIVFLYYLRLDWQFALAQAPVNIALLLAADRFALLPLAQSAAIFGAAFILGWIIQLIGHAIEGKRPALADNLLQVFNAPLFLTAEVVFALGLRGDLQSNAHSFDKGGRNP